MTNKQTFKESYERLEDINKILDRDDIIDVDELIKLQDESHKLYIFCNSKLKDLDIKINSNQDSNEWV